VRLRPVERAKLLEEIYRSLETKDASETTREWAREAESRLSAFERGEIPTRPYSEIKDSIDR